MSAAGLAGRSLSADERPEDAVRKEAFAWYARLCSGEATEADRAAWAQWHAQHPDHARVWQRIDAIRATVQRVPGHIAAPALRAARPDRRSALRGIALVASGGTLAALSWKIAAPDGGWSALLAAHRTGTGEQREIALPDGSRLVLNTRSAVDVDFDASQRRIRLREGEILIETAKRADGRPFRVETVHGSIRALGTRFVARVDGAHSAVTVLQDAVEVTAAADPARRVDAGRRLRFTGQGAGVLEAADPGAGEWANGSLIVDDWSLAEVVAELGRYRAGRLACDPRVGALRVSGAFPVQDTDRALRVLAQSLPVRIASLTRYWVTVEPR